MSPTKKSDSGPMARQQIKDEEHEIDKAALWQNVVITVSAIPEVDASEATIYADEIVEAYDKRFAPK
jgi:hypothetical protein